MIKINSEQQMGGLTLLSELEDDKFKCVFFDPQYRGILDKMQYGNEGVRRGKARSSLVQMSQEMISDFLREIERILRPSGYLFLWVDKFHLCEGVRNWFEDDSQMEIVDLVVWNKLKIGMGYRTRRKCEYLLIVQKKPKLAKKTWTLHDIPDVWDEKVTKKHPHSKPIQLQSKLIEAVTDNRDYVVDPAAGGYSVLDACLATGRNFIGCDIENFKQEM